MPQCTAKAKSTKKRCTRNAVTGSNVCQVHGAGSIVKDRSGGRPATHARYSNLKTDNLKTLIEQHAADPDPLNINPELAAARALFQDFIERYDEWSAALIAWHETYESGEGPSKPQKILDIGDAYRIVSEITKIVQRITAMKNQNAISRRELLRVMTEMTRVVDQEVQDEFVKRKIKDGWLGIRLA